MSTFHRSFPGMYSGKISPIPSVEMSLIWIVCGGIGHAPYFVVVFVDAKTRRATSSPSFL